MFSIFFVSGALLQTGVADSVGGKLHSLVGSREVPLIILVMLVAGVLSAFMNNVAAAAVMLPAISSLARQAGLAPGRLFMPPLFWRHPRRNHHLGGYASQHLGGGGAG